MPATFSATDIVVCNQHANYYIGRVALTVFSRDMGHFSSCFHCGHAKTLLSLTFVSLLHKRCITAGLLPIYTHHNAYRLSNRQLTVYSPGFGRTPVLYLIA